MKMLQVEILSEPLPGFGEGQSLAAPIKFLCEVLKDDLPLFLYLCIYLFTLLATVFILSAKY